MLYVALLLFLFFQSYLLLLFVVGTLQHYFKHDYHFLKQILCSVISKEQFIHDKRGTHINILI